MAIPQFGEVLEARDYQDRPAAFGVAELGGEIAVVRVQKPGLEPWWDLPGGAIDEGETEAEAVVREFGEETGLKVAADVRFAAADQYFLSTEGAAYNNRAGFWTVSMVAVAGELKIEADHELIWVPPHDALRRLRHDAHAWAVAAWLRRKA